MAEFFGCTDRSKNEPVILNLDFVWAISPEGEDKLRLNYWVSDETNGFLVISGDDIQKLRKKLPTGVFPLNMVSE